MKRFRDRLRILLVAFVVGIFFVSVYSRLMGYIDAMTADIPTVTVEEIPVDLPVIESESPLIVRPQDDRFYPDEVGSS